MAAETVAKEMVENVTEEVAETEIVTVAETEEAVAKVAGETVAEEMSENVSEEEAETDREVGETEEVVKRKGSPLLNIAKHRKFAKITKITMIFFRLFPMLC